MNSTFTANHSSYHIQCRLYFLLLFILLMACLLLAGGIIAQFYNAEVLETSVNKVAWFWIFFTYLSSFDKLSLSILAAFVCAAVHCLNFFRSNLYSLQYEVIADNSSQNSVFRVKRYKTVVVSCVAFFLYLMPQFVVGQAQTPVTVSVCEGETVTLALPENDAQFIQWWYRDSQDYPFEIIAGATGYTYTFQATAADNNRIYEGDYESKVTGWGSSAYLIKVNPVPVTPTAAGASRQGAGSVTLTASGAPTGGSYRWYTVATNGTQISGATSASYTTPSLTATTTYYVAAVNATGCESARKAVTATIINTAPSVPVDANAALNTVAEKAATGTLAGITAKSTDPEGTPVSFALTDNAGGRFAIDAQTGVVTVANGALLQYTTASAHTIKVRATDGSIFSDEQAFTISVTRINAAPVATSINHPVTLLNTAAATSLTTLAATDDVAVHTFRITSGPATGILYVNGTQIELNKDYPWAQANTLTFDPAESNYDDIQLSYTVTDNEGKISGQAILTIPINGVPLAINTENFKKLSSSAPRTAISPFKGNDADGTISHFRLITLPTARKGILYINGLKAELNVDYEWSLRNMLSFDPHYGNAEHSGFSFTVKDSEGAYAATPASYRVLIVLDYDLDGITDDLDLDDDNDGIPDTIEGEGDNDKDGIKNSFDLDADGDGLTDVQEYLQDAALLANYDRFTGRLTGKVGTNGLLDALETSPDSGKLKAIISFPDTDGDGLANYLDYDADNDGLADNLEAQPTGNRVVASGIDSDMDGIDDAYDLTCGCAENGVALTPIDTDEDELPDYLDLDSDNDLISDTEEAFDFNDNGNSLDDLQELVGFYQSRMRTTSETNTYNLVDSNNNQIPDMFEDDNVNGRQNFLEPGHIHYIDADYNGFVDLADESMAGTETIPNYSFRILDAKTQLPVYLAGLAATPKLNGVSINWLTAMEVDNDYFEVQRSVDGKTFTKIKQVKGAGYSSQKLAYTFLDMNAPAGELYYRLKQVDFNGKYTYSHIVSVEMKSLVSSAKLFPNPATAFIKLSLTELPTAIYQVRMVNMEGKVLQTIALKNSREHVFDTQHLPVGKYLLQVQSEVKSYTLSFIKQ
ncbi:hypothetical protein DP923_06415 [Pontibacter arcticus]|uniref:Cadherin domain-containing protein n=2 Tax=Pontibacter arcticus TaxID=2080288 RepID=A0A364RF36_9BACT|nr:hypothetical protein DP923_06415 [Pontibacter arcticus]